MNDHIKAAERIDPKQSRLWDWLECCWLRWKFYRAQTEVDYEETQVTLHLDRAAHYRHETEFWRNRQMARGFEVGYDYQNITWLMNLWLGVGICFAGLLAGVCVFMVYM